MAHPLPHAYTHNHQRLSDSSVAFECSQDVGIWPWLSLPPTHQIRVQSANFWASVESGITLGTFDPNKWSALTQVDWTIGPESVGPAIRGLYTTDLSAETKRYQLDFFDADDCQVVTLSGTGVVFKTRDFEGWRGDTKARMVKPEHAQGFTYAAPDALGAGTQAECFLGPLHGGADGVTEALITKANGFIPGHPYIGGSGDHVNSTHMGEVGRQFATLLAGRGVRIVTGEMVFLHYVELGRPFELRLIEQDEAESRFSLLVRQADRDCTRIMMTYAGLG